MDNLFTGSSLQEVTTRAGKLNVHVWDSHLPASPPRPSLTIVTVHPWAPLGGSEFNCAGVAREFAAAGLRALSFDLRSSSMVWGVLSNHSSEVNQVVDVCEWAAKTFGGQVLLFGSSAGSPQAGSALDQCESVVGLACVGYTWGWLSSVAFGRHFSAFLKSPKPRLSIMGDRDEFTSESTLRRQLAKGSKSGACESIIFPGVGHFELESPAFDGRVTQAVLEWIGRKGWHGASAAGR